MVSREGDLERKQYLVGSEWLLISDNMKPDIMVPGNGDPLPHTCTHISKVSSDDYSVKSQLSTVLTSFQEEISHSVFRIIDIKAV